MVYDIKYPKLTLSEFELTKELINNFDMVSFRSCSQPRFDAAHCQRHTESIGSL